MVLFKMIECTTPAGQYALRTMYDFTNSRDEAYFNSDISPSLTTADNVSFDPTGSILSTNLQDGLIEVNEKTKLTNGMIAKFRELKLLFYLVNRY